MNTCDWIHMIFVLYFMIGGFLPNPHIYLKISMVTIFGWVLFGNCVLNLGRGFPKDSIIRQFAKEINSDEEMVNKIFEFFIDTSIATAIYRTRDLSILYVIGLYVLSRYPTFKETFYKDSKTFIS